ncbi:MAG: methyltransferase domain-containing protein [Gammaproteobacteria bacterium]|nr:methyltransferase domain-containing protein [Gammaproteobacteria bacterium]
MNTISSYNISTISSDIKVEIQRLEGQVDLFWGIEFPLYKKYGLCNDLTILEVGSGPGFLSNKLLSNLNNISLYSLDIDPLLIEFAHKNRIQYSSKHEIIKGSLTNCCFSNDFFDVAIVRLVLEHLPDPIAAIKEVSRVLRPNGKVFIIDNDFSVHLITYPPIKELERFYDAYCKARTEQGGHPMLGRKLPTILRLAGYSLEGFESLCAHSECIGESAFKKSEGFGIAVKLVQEGYLTSQDFYDMVKAWRNMTNTNDHGMMRQLFMAVGRKPT